MNVLETVKELVAEQIGEDPESTEKFSKMHLDSLDLTELVIELEIAFDIELSDEEVEKITEFTIPQLAEYIDKRISP